MSNTGDKNINISLLNNENKCVKIQLYTWSFVKNEMTLHCKIYFKENPNLWKYRFPDIKSLSLLGRLFLYLGF